MDLIAGEIGRTRSETLLCGSPFGERSRDMNDRQPHRHGMVLSSSASEVQREADSTNMTIPYDEKKAIAKLKAVSTATLTTLLLKKGLRNVWLQGVKPIKPKQPRTVGRAFTLRFVPAREDIATPENWSSPVSTRGAIEAMPQNCVAVVDAMGVSDAGIFGDILCARMAKRGVAALVTDGVIRDVQGVLATGLPVWCSGVAAPPSFAGLTFVNWQEPIACGGVAVFPDDLIVIDDDGAVLVPAKLVDELVEQGIEQEELDGWIMSEVERGVPLLGLYPPNKENMARYEAFKADKV